MLNRLGFIKIICLPKKVLFTAAFILGLLVTFCHVSDAQNAGFFERITTENGLSQSDVNTIIQDREGFIWFGTHDGLNRYDGYNFKTFKPDPNNPESISSNLIFDLTEDQEGNLWIATTGGGLVFFNTSEEKFRTFKYDKDNVKRISSNYVSSAVIDRENRLWIGTSQGINMLDLNKSIDSVEFKRFKTQQEPFMPDRDIKSVTTVYEDAKGQIWTGGYGGIYKLSREPNGDSYFKFFNRELNLPNGGVASIKEFKGRLLIGSKDGLYFQEKKTSKVNKILEGSYNTLLVANNVVWAGTNNGFLKIEISDYNDKVISTEKFVFDPINLNSISKDNIISLCKDKTGIIWVGTNGGGVNKFDPNRKQFQHIRNTLNPKSLSYDKIRAFFEDSNNNLWVGTEGGGLNLLKKGTNNEEYQKINTISNVYAIDEVSIKNRRTIIYGGLGIPSLYTLDISDNTEIDASKITPIPEITNSIFSILVDSNNILWIGTYNGGVHRWIPSEDGKNYIKHNFRNDSNDSKSLSGNIIRYIFEDSKGNIWFATGSGLSMLRKSEADKKYPKFEVFRNIPNSLNSISHNYILSIQEDKNGSIWIGTFGGGLNKVLSIEEGGTFKSYSEKDGLPNNVVKGILEDNEGYLWLSTNKGLSRFEPVQGVFKNYDVNDGLQSNEFQELAFLKRKNGDFIFGGVNGFNIFRPKDLRENTYLPETVITNFFISNKEVTVGDELDGEVVLHNIVSKTEEVTLNHNQNNISFEFAALHYAAPEKNKFKYKLEGFDENWQTSSSDKRFAAYTNLAPGSYTFKVKASNNDGLWNEEPAVLNVDIAPPFWLTWWAYFLYALIVLGILWSIQSYFNLRSKQRASLQVQKEIEEVNKLKLQFFTNISHEFKTPITLILNPVEELLESVKVGGIQSKLKIVQRNANSLLRLVHQLMEFRKIEVGETKLGATEANIVNFVKEVTYAFKTSGKKEGVDVSFESEVYVLNTWFDWDKLEKILNNLIYNAIKFTPEGGQITVSVSKSKGSDLLDIKERGVKTDFVQIEVADTGVGIDKEQLPYVFQRFYQVNQSLRKKENKGSGIGLAITKDLVDLHHGDITVESEKGKGTCFLIKLPLGKEHLMPEEIVENSVAEAIEEEVVGAGNTLESIDAVIDIDKQKNTLLVVDDNKDIRDLIKEGFKTKYNILSAENGKEALSVALTEMPDLIVSDVLMPEMDGVELCFEVKNNIRTSHIPVILLTALNSVEHKIEGIESGADAYIPKPFKMRLLAVTINKLIETRDLMRKRFQTEKELTPDKIALNSIDEAFLKGIMDFMEANMGNDSYWVDELAFDMNTSRSTFFRKLKKLTGQSPNDFMRIVRLKRAVQLLEQDELTIAQVSYMVGFKDPGYFGKCFRKIYGVAPSNYLINMKEG